MKLFKKLFLVFLTFNSIVFSYEAENLSFKYSFAAENLIGKPIYYVEKHIETSKEYIPSNFDNILDLTLMGISFGYIGFVYIYLLNSFLLIF